MRPDCALALKVDVDTLRGTLEGVPRLVAVLRALGAGGDVLLQRRPGSHRARAEARAATRISAARCAAPQSSRITAGARCSTARCCRARRSARAPATRCARARRGLRGGRALLRPRALAGRRRACRCGLDASANSCARSRPSRQCLAPRRSRTRPPAGSSTRRRCSSRAAARLQLRERHARHAALSARDGAVCAGTCMQIPTTLPTLDELIGTDGLTADSGLRRAARAHASPPSAGPGIHGACGAGGRAARAAVRARCCSGWRGRRLRARTRCAISPPSCDRDSLPRHVIAMGSIPGRSGVLALQGAARSEPAGA